ncbi:SMI1/KNR4 family protein [Xylocopilactobacillus apis]|uniref:Knr4/Smi1-like domain-containing protein n=1 Tax=Xylocopilactobacillus apis TaxID=2932183 RepID=A0AAU9D0F9_9LACO|nr:SMI1/KNR4 family protein [Xylocopilactobacillus apis]BDR55760.1 hypothetical protein KIMC2_03220 [Xylocopilactobacillus apis]
MFVSKYETPENLDKLIEKIETDTQIKFSKSYLNFLKRFNVVEFDGNYNIKSGKESISIETIFGFSKQEEEDIESVSRFYRNRIPSSYLPVASINSEDIVCINSQGKIYHWNHEINDLYFNKEPNSYQPQNEKLSLIAESFDDFLKLIFLSKETQPEERYDVYMDSTVPFPDKVLGIFFENPKLFFSNNTGNRVQIYLKKLELSEKGQELLTLLRKENLL